MSQESYTSYRLSEAELRRIEAERRELEEKKRRAEEERLRREARERVSWAQDVEGLRSRVGPASAAVPVKSHASAKDTSERLSDEILRLKSVLRKARREGRGGELAQAIADAERALESAQSPGRFTELQLMSLQTCGMQVETAARNRGQNRMRLLAEVSSLAKHALLDEDRTRAAQLLTRLNEGDAPEDLQTSVDNLIQNNREVELANRQREYMMIALNKCLTEMGYSVESWSAGTTQKKGAVRTDAGDTVELNFDLSAVHLEFHASALATASEAESRCQKWCDRWAELQLLLKAQGVIFDEHWSKPPSNAAVKRLESLSERKPESHKRTR